MKKRLFSIVFFVLFSNLSFCSNLNVFNEFRSVEFQDNLVVSVNNLCLNLKEILPVSHKQLYNLLQTSFNLTSCIINRDKVGDGELSLFSDLICNLFDLMNLNNIDIDEIDFDFVYINKIQKVKIRDFKKQMVDRIIAEKTSNKNAILLEEIFVLLSALLRNNIKTLFEDVKEEVFFYLDDNIIENVVKPVSLVLRRKGKKTKIAAAIFGAIANACVSLAKIVTGKTNDDKKEGVLNLAGTAFGLASDINNINSYYSSDRNVNFQPKLVKDRIVNLAEKLYKVITDNNINVDERYSFWIEKLDSFDTLEKRTNWLKDTLSSRNLNKDLIKAIFKCLETCLNQIVDSILEELRDKLIEYLAVHAKQ